MKQPVRKDLTHMDINQFAAEMARFSRAQEAYINHLLEAIRKARRSLNDA